MKIDPCYQQQKCRHFWQYKIYVNIHGISPGRGHQTTVELLTTAIFIVFADYFSVYFGDEASVII